MEFKIQHIEETTSTNSAILSPIQNGAEEGFVLWADFQTSGRGKPGSVWHSSAGKDLLFSIYLKPEMSASEAPMLTQISCRSIAKALLDHYGIESTFKRPNDILVDGKKICGVLTEAASQGSKVDYVIVGVGLNVNSLENELILGATSLKMEKSQDFDRNEVLNHILSQFKSDLLAIY